MPHFSALYRQTFADLGVPLATLHAVEDTVIALAERRLGVKTPEALRAYYSVAGAETKLNQAHNNLLAPTEWFLDAGRLVFMAENQGVVFWGVGVGGRIPDPPVDQGVNEKPIAWYSEHLSCSRFLLLMLCWHAAVGGLGRTRVASVTERFGETLDASWQRLGAMGDLHVFLRDGVAICWARSPGGWQLFLSSASPDAVTHVGQQLGLEWDKDYD